MGRLRSDPGIGSVFIERTSGPAGRGSGRQTAVDGSEQTIGVPGNRLSFRVDLRTTQYGSARKISAWLTDMRSGANWSRWHMQCPDQMTLDQMGYPVKGAEWGSGVTWDGASWGQAPPMIDVGAASAKGSEFVTLANQQWANRVDEGWMLGFGPSHFGAYEVMEVMDTRRFRIWPTLRKALTTDDVSRLDPVLVVKAAPGSISGGRGIVAREGDTVELVEVMHSHVEAAGFL